MAYRQKPDLNGDPNTNESRTARLYIFGLLPFVVLAPNLGRIAHLLGFETSYQTILFVTVVMTGVCVLGGIMAYRNAQRQVARDAADLLPKKP